MAKNKTKKQNSKKGRKVFITIICVILVICIGAFAVGFNYWNSLKNAPIEVEDTLVYDFDDETQASELVDDPVFDTIYEGDATAYKDAIKQWATNNGDIMYSKDVINILCIGVDTRNQTTVSGLTDSMIIISINKNLGTITLTSIMRDSFAYLESPGGEGSFNKINSAFPFYGIDNLINTIQNHFKIRIDGYAMINFSFFKAVIDKLGGVTVPVQQYEADYINKVYGFNVPSGNAVTLNGDEALGFCRSRKCDSDGDVSRTRRQRQVITSLLKKAVTIETSEITDYIATFMPYLKTSYSEADVVSLATKAVVGGWANFELQEIVMPDEESRKAHNGETWYWIVDYPKAAQNLQNKIYGYSNIELDENRVSPLNMGE
ncbi:MAG: LCP family protein [Acutalibacteraceae bacterium]